VKWAELHVVEGTESPTIRVGRRVIECAGTTKPSRRWTATWCAGGRARTRALKTTLKKEAIREAFALYQQLRAGKVPQSIKPISIEQLCALYLAIVEAKGRSRGTLRAYRNALGRFVEWAQHRGIIAAAALVEDDIYSFKKWLLTALQRGHKKSQKVGVAPKSIYFRLIVVKQMTKWAHRTGKLPSNPFINAEVEEPPHVRQPVFTHEQVAALVDKAPEPWKTLWLTFACTGMRFGEVADLEWSDVLLKEGAHGVFVISKGGIRGGAGEVRIIRTEKLIPPRKTHEPSAAASLESFLKSSPWWPDLSCLDRHKATAALANISAHEPSLRSLLLATAVRELRMRYNRKLWMRC
jgi:integrase